MLEKQLSITANGRRCDQGRTETTARRGKEGLTVRKREDACQRGGVPKRGKKDISCGFLIICLSAHCLPNAEDT
jgi:hypothetical protein